jgi:cytochrome b561
VAIWAITLARLLWRRTFSRFPAFPERMSIAQQWLVAATERSLYGLLLLQPLTGMASTIALGRPFALFVWTVPALVPRSLEISLWLAGVHAATAGCLLAVVGVHAARALVHRYLLRDDIFEAMAPWTRKRAKRAAIRELRVVANSREA